MSNKWHSSLKKKPAHRRIVIGYWGYLTGAVSDPCFYDEETEKWGIETQEDGYVELERPDYWIETPE